MNQITDHRCVTAAILVANFEVRIHKPNQSVSHAEMMAIGDAPMVRKTKTVTWSLATEYVIFDESEHVEFSMERLSVPITPIPKVELDIEEAVAYRNFMYAYLRRVKSIFVPDQEEFLRFKKEFLKRRKEWGPKLEQMHT